VTRGRKDRITLVVDLKKKKGRPEKETIKATRECLVIEKRGEVQAVDKFWGTHGAQYRRGKCFPKLGLVKGGTGTALGRGGG